MDQPTIRPVASEMIEALIAILLFGALWVIAMRRLVPADRQLVGVSPPKADMVHHVEVANDSADD